MVVRLDLHMHTRYSKDSAAPIQSVVRRCQQMGLGIVAITDHDNIRGALAVQQAASFPVIIGEEIKSSAGDIIGLFLEEEVPAKLPPLDTVKRIKDQGGLVLIPHPFDRVRPSAIKPSDLLEILPFIDLIEGYNAHNLFASDNDKGKAFAKEHSLPMVACSDSHSALELGHTYTEVPDFDVTPEGLVLSVKAGQMVGHRPNPLLLLTPGYAKLRKVLS